MAPGDYLRGVLADGARPFRYRAGVRELLGLPDDTGVPVSFGTRIPAAAFTYLRAPDAFPVEDAPPEWLAAPDAGWFDEPAPSDGPDSRPSTPQSTVDTLLTIPGSTPRPAGDARWSAVADRRPDAVGPPVPEPPDAGDGSVSPRPGPNPIGPGFPGVVAEAGQPAEGEQPGAGRYGGGRRLAGTAGAGSPRGAEPPTPAPPSDASGDGRAASRPASADPGTGAGVAGGGAPLGDPAAVTQPPALSDGMRGSTRSAFPRGPVTGFRSAGTPSMGTPFTGTGSGPAEPGALTDSGALADPAALTDPGAPADAAALGDAALAAAARDGATARDATARDAAARDAAGLGGADSAAGRDSAAALSRGGSALRPIPTTAPTRSSRPVPPGPVRTPDPAAEDSGTGEFDAFEPPYRRAGERRRAAPQSPAAPEPAAPPAAPPAQVVVIRQAAPPVVSTAAFWERRHVGRLRARILR